MIIPQISQVPLQEPMYVHGVMTPVWIRFFERLSNLRNDADLIQLIELAQKVAELPSQSIQAQQGFDLIALQNQVEQIPIFMQHQNLTFDYLPVYLPEQIPIENIPISAPHIEHLPPLQAVFLCPVQDIPFIEPPTDQVIKA
ncbi:hypothetical protein [Acinetobacter sp. Marseille-Q1618]|uniref:hypothetical protein n=1 Tax=Acinetobacter sp. Marseille-Q1618 TaxID=2697502 RepID=UPI00156E104D|nr:hypothetical protein [Acinetobacter sp. Marseille-Q1618]